MIQIYSPTASTIKKNKGQYYFLLLFSCIHAYIHMYIHICILHFCCSLTGRWSWRVNNVEMTLGDNYIHITYIYVYTYMYIYKYSYIFCKQLNSRDKCKWQSNFRIKQNKYEWKKEQTMPAICSCIIATTTTTTT